ncbi:hypothetical protein [Pseudomonas sp. RIT-PI-S]|uniref:hypothetical protein n=1 Tax=Pseudomonas sp. RIT-PI-S TaxID=3035295 RepID=UPI0021D8ED51|nr:hypothetical protein [Pseudomonas sp. RIT-PI-S]
MKQWQITFTDKSGSPSSISVPSEHRPSDEEAAVAIRAKMFPVIHEVPLNDFDGRDEKPTAKWLEEQNGMKITAITEA